MLASPPSAEAQASPALAQQRFEQGLAHYRAQRWDEALAAFRASYELAPSPNSRLFIGRSLRELGELGRAYGELRLAATEADQRASTDPRYAPTADAARSEARELEPRIARITVIVPEPPPGLRVTVAGREIPEAGLGLAVPVDPGEIEVTAEAPAHARFVATRTVAAGDAHTMRIAMEETRGPDTSEPPSAGAGAREADRGDGTSFLTVSGIVLAGIAVAAAVSFTVFYLLADARFDDLSDDCLPAACPPERRDEIDEGRTYQTLANVSLGVAVGAAAVGAALLLAGALDGGSAPGSQARAPGVIARW